MRKTSGRRRGNSDGPHGAPRLSKSGGEEPRRRRTDVWSRSGEDASHDRLQPPTGVMSCVLFTEQPIPNRHPSLLEIVSNGGWRHGVVYGAVLPHVIEDIG